MEKNLSFVYTVIEDILDYRLEEKDYVWFT